ncbi:MAG: hypothetical protein ABIS50_24290 [Luteolibacter sp.]|uniref:hypothetical protein n=1 Tax=Luteolibacter sp. TaxID=1962973 RepID=UPI003264C0FC
MSASSAKRNTFLSTYASGLAQDRKNSLANFIAPVVAVGAASGQYKKYNSKNDFQVLDTSRAIAGPRKRIEFLATDPFFNCLPQGLETGLDDHERKLAGDGVQALEQSRIKNLVGAALTSHEKKVFDIVKAAKAATGGVGVWSNAAIDPVAEIDAQILDIATATGQMANRIIFGLGAWQVFRNHALVKARQPGAEVVGVQGDQAMRMVLNPQMDFRIGIMSADATKFGAAANNVNIVGAEVFVFYSSEDPDQMDASFAKTFATTGSMIDGVREYREENAASDIFFVDWTEDIQVVATECGRRMTIS